MRVSRKASTRMTTARVTMVTLVQKKTTVLKKARDTHRYPSWYP